MNTHPYVHDDPVPEIEPRGHHGYGLVHIVGLSGIAALLGTVMLLTN